MIGSRPRMPKRARYPIFLVGLAIIVIGGLGLMEFGTPEPATAGIVVAGLLLVVASVILK